jgi:SAM-dependent methyltransferase
MRPSSDVLDVGCGIGRLAYECAWYLDDDATYVGLDISPTVIDWLNSNYAPRLPGFRFDFLDVYNESYRPTGSIGPEQVRLPYSDDRFDVVCAFEVFMHVSLEGIRKYLREMARVLRPGGLAVVTFVGVYPDERVSFDAEYVQVGPGIYSTRPDDMSSDMAYDVDLVRCAVADAALGEVGSVKGRIHTPFDRRPGSWAPEIDYPPIFHGCDVLAARKATTITQHLRTTSGRSRWRSTRKPRTNRSRIEAIDSTDTQIDSNDTKTASAAPTAPGAPTIRKVTAGNSSGTVSWTAPASNGCSSITGYAVTAQATWWITGVYGRDRTAKTTIFNSTAPTQTVTGLINGAEYRFWVRAYNAAGISAYSTASNPITPAE